LNTHFLDTLSLASIFSLSFLLMVLMLELGFRYGQLRSSKGGKAQIAQVRALMGATLGLLAFMLAFTFSGAQSHFENRIQLQIDEAVLAKNAFMQADLYPEPYKSEARRLLFELVDGRVKLLELVRAKQGEQIFALLQESSAIHKQLWSLGADDGPVESHEFRQTVLGLMDMQTRRTNAALANRIPFIVWITLFFTAGVAMLVVGYQAGLSATRSPMATYSLALAFSAVMVLTMDLDRPLQTLFEMDVTVMSQLAEFMHASE
jgi:hypothetical protein